MAISELEIWQSAHVLIQQHGAAAWIVAASRHRELNASGDTEGAAVYKRIADAIAQLEDLALEEPN